MRLIRSILAFGGIAAGCALLATGTNAATLVVRVSGPSAGAYPAGKLLADTAQIALKTNDEIVLLDEQGTRTLRGPGTFSALASTSAAPSGATVISAVVDQRSDRRVRIGAVRGVEGSTSRPPNIWFIDASRGGTVCVADPPQARVWRPDPEQADSMTAAPASGTPARIEWDAGQAVQYWPQALPLTEGAQYNLAVGSARPTAIRVARIGAAPDELQGMAQALIAHGCTAQIDLLVATASAAAAAAGQ